MHAVSSEDSCRKMNGKFVTLCLVGLFGSLFVGYCVYFDKKRRSDPDYKKKVVARRRLKRLAAKQNTIDLRDPKVREEFLMSEVMKANQKMAEGNVEEALPHFINFIHFSGNPNATLMTLQQSMPAPLFNLIYQAYMAMRMQGIKSAAGQKTSTAAAAKKTEAEVD